MTERRSREELVPVPTLAFYQKDYEKALAEGWVDVAYSRLMLLGAAGAGKTCLKQSLMKEQWNPSTQNSTVISDVHSIRPVGYEWQNLGDNQWRKITEEDEIQEMAELLVAVHGRSGIGEFRSKISVTELFQINNSSLNNNDPSMENIESEKKKVQEILSKAIERAKFINTTSSDTTSSDITSKPFVHMWDCGGQPVFLEILPAFLTSRTMFLLVYDASKSFTKRWKSMQTFEGYIQEEEEVNMTSLDLIHSWLSTIHLHLAKLDSKKALLDYPRVLCIGTHGDKVGDPLANIEELKSYCVGKPYDDLIDGFYVVDNTTAGKTDEDASLSKIRDKIYNFTSDKLIVKTPISWVLFRKVIDTYNKHVITLKEACAIGVACKIPAKMVPNMLLFYHDLGALLFYPHIEGLCDKVIINPKWFISILGKVLTLKGREELHVRRMWSLLREKGILVQPLYVAAWKEVAGDVDPEALIELLVHFHLAAEITTDEYNDPDVKQYFLPLVLPSYVCPEFPLALLRYHYRATPMHLKFRTEFVPPGFFTRLITKVAESPKCEILFRKKVYRNRIQVSYGSPSYVEVILMELANAIQAEIFQYQAVTNQSSTKFSKVCQMLCKELCTIAEDVDFCLFGGGNQENKKCKFLKKVRFLCAGCSSPNPHYLDHKDGQTNDFHICCDENDEYREICPDESYWFPSNINEPSDNLLEEEFLKISKKIPNQDELYSLAAHLNLWDNLKIILADSNRCKLAGVHLLDDFKKANGGRSQLVEALDKMEFHNLARMVEQCEYNPDKIKRNSVEVSSIQQQELRLPQTPITRESIEEIQTISLTQTTLSTIQDTAQEAQISDNELLNCTKYLKKNEIDKLIEVLDDPALDLKSVSKKYNDQHAKAHQILKKWLKANPHTSKETLQEKLRILGFNKAAKNLCLEDTDSDNDSYCLII